MLYLAVFIVRWFIHALLPALAAGVVAALLAFLLTMFRRRTHGYALITGLTAAACVCASLTWRLGRDFAHPEFAMFRKYIANPIPREVTHLEPADPSPIMFNTGAIIRFEAPESVLRGIIDHSLKGSTAQRFFVGLKQSRARGHVEQPTTSRISDGKLSYVRIDSAGVSASLDSVFGGLRYRVAQAERGGREVYLLAQSGDWGRYESLMAYDRAAHRIEIRQNVALSPVPVTQNGVPHTK